jgi:DNA-3-methyladenine glycosylase II
MHYINHLKKDKKLAVTLKYPIAPLTLKKNAGIKLIQSIMSQQLSTKVAAVIYNRFLALYQGKEPGLRLVADTPFTTLQSIGLSKAKTQYIKNVAAFFIEQKITDKKISTLSNEEIINLLTQIKGVGRWTVEMLLMFTLGRENVFAVDDLGIQQGMTQLYNLNTNNKKELKTNMINIAANWAPYQTYACLHIWKWKDAQKSNNK